MASKKHLELSTFIKGVHQSLRLQSRAIGADQAWLQHCEQTHVLEKYAEAMHLLATEFWNKNNCENKDVCRIQWVVNYCMEYFHNGGHERAHAKEDKMSQRYFDKALKMSQSSIHTSTVLKLLDVGSCYNPFSKIPMFDVTALDLMPATTDVFKCDFMTVAISSGTEHIENPCLDLPEKYFDIVVFSLFLEYFPSSKQRFKCCKKAYELLTPSGVLIILTPDSKHATANSKVMKNWRAALASLGFWRVSYQKLRHLHCMSYRRCVDATVPQYWLNLQQCTDKPEDMLVIPQDFHKYCDNTIDDETVAKRCDTDNKLLADSFCDMPDSDIYS